MSGRSDRRQNTALINPERRFAALAIAALLVLSCGQPGADQGAAKANAKEEGAPTAAAIEKKVLRPVSLGELPEAVARLSGLQEEVEKALVVDEAERRAAAQLDVTLRRIDRSRKRVEQLPFDELTETARRLIATERTVTDNGAVVSNRLRRVEQDIREVEQLKEKFAAFATLAETSAAPASIHDHIRACRAQLDELSARLGRRRTDVLLLVDKLAEAKGGVAAMRAMTQSRVIDTRRQLSAMAEAPIWRLQPGGSEAIAETAHHLVRDGYRIRRWLTANEVRILLITVVCFGGMVAMLRRLRSRAAKDDDAVPYAAARRKIAASPLAAGIPVTIMTIVALSPQAPTIVYDVAWLVAAPAAAVVMVRMLGRGFARTVWVLAASLALAPVAGAVGALPFALRLILILQSLPLALALGFDLSRNRFAELGMDERARTALTIVAWILVAFLATATAGCILGWVGLASILSGGVLGTLGGIIVIVACYLVLSVVLRHAVSSRRAHLLLMVREHGEVVAETVLTVLRVVAVLSAVSVSIESFGVRQSLRAAFVSFFGAKATLGSITISAGSIAGFILTLAIAGLLARVIGFVLSEEVLPRLAVRRGTARAISATTRYLILLAGFVLAAGAAGVDLTTFGFLAGALGVGIGFGLQNIVSNFISGLILLFERPIQVGDAVEVSGATGSVTEIGIRASIVHTFDGAEVIVPNADLITKPVTNWTRTNENRRFDIPVGVAYGSPLETTAHSLLEAARRTAGIIPHPAPEAFFKSFGSSSLDWALRVWVRLDESPRILSDLKRAMNEELEKAGIGIPFPQRDLHIRSFVPASRETLVADEAQLRVLSPKVERTERQEDPLR